MDVCFGGEVGATTVTGGGPLRPFAPFDEPRCVDEPLCVLGIGAPLSFEGVPAFEGFEDERPHARWWYARGLWLIYLLRSDGGAKQLLLGGFLAGQGAVEPALVHDHDAVAHPKHFQQLGGDHHNRDALRG